MLSFAITHTGPVAVRYPREEAAQGESSPIVYGKSQQVVKGSKLAIVAVGTMLATAMEIAQKLDIKPSVYNARFIKPLDMELVAKLREYEHIITIEDGVRIGGFGMRLFEAVRSPSFHIFAFVDSFLETGTRQELLAKYKLDAESIALVCNKLLQ